MFIRRWNTLVSAPGLLLITLATINYLLAVFYVANYRALLDTIDEAESIVSVGIDGFTMLAYFDTFALIGLGSLPALVAIANLSWRAVNALSAIWCIEWRIKKCRERQGIPTDNFDRYNDEFDFSVTEDDITNLVKEYERVRQERANGEYHSYNHGRPQETGVRKIGSINEISEETKLHSLQKVK